MALPHRKGYASAGQAVRSKAFLLTPGAELDLNCPCGMVHVRKPAVPNMKATPSVLPDVRRAPGEFTPRVKRLIRTRAGLGDQHEARCEGCGYPLGISGGQFQHRTARGTGGCRGTVLNGPAGGLLLCGNPLDKSTCHGFAETRSEQAERWGLWIKHGTTPACDPRLVPVFWHRTTWLWLPENGGPYLAEAPKERAA